MAAPIRPRWSLREGRLARLYWAARSAAAALRVAAHRRTLVAQIERALAGRTDVQFVQVGSHDGVRGDPLRALVARHPAWRGVFVEPGARAYAKLRAGYPRDTHHGFEAVAVAGARGTRLLHGVDPAAELALPGGLPRWYDQLASLREDHAVSLLGERIRPFVVSEEVPCRTLGDILADHGIEHLDLLHVDAEGSDDEVLAQLDFDAHPLLVVLFEHVHLPPRRRERAESRLRAAGFRLSRHGPDTLATRRPEAPARLG